MTMNGRSMNDRIRTMRGLTQSTRMCNTYYIKILLTTMS
jgi:hypothetical protein